MIRKVLHSKLHMARVTAASINYAGSITIDAELLKHVGMDANDAVLVADVRNGQRFETYVIPGEAGSGVIQVNGASAHLVAVGDPLIILHFAWMTPEERRTFKPRILVLNEKNEVARKLRYDPPLLPDPSSFD